MGKDPKMEIVRCGKCGELTIRAGGLGKCPTGCNAPLGNVITTVKVPRSGVKKALKEADGG